MHIFVRRGIVDPKNAKQLIFYMTHLRKDIQGYADFIEQKTLGHESLLRSNDEYQDSLQGRKKAAFIRFRNLRDGSKPVTTKEMIQIIRKVRMPQMGMYITEKMAHKLI